MTRRYKPKRVNASDPMVPLNRPFLKAAIELSGLEMQEIARRAGTTKQNLSYMLGGETPGRCRASLRQQLAAALEMPEPLLGGGAPVIEGWVVMVLGGALIYAPSSAGLYASLRLLQRCLDAAARDGFTEQETRDLAHAVGLLLRPHRWRSRLTNAPEDLSLNVSDAALACVRVLEFGLAPWLDGDAKLDLKQLAAAADLAGARRRGEPSPTPTTVLRPLASLSELLGTAPDATEIDLTGYTEKTHE